MSRLRARIIVVEIEILMCVAVSGGAMAFAWLAPASGMVVPSLGAAIFLGLRSTFHAHQVAVSKKREFSNAAG
jgi:hypothetical protein